LPPAAGHINLMFTDPLELTVEATEPSIAPAITPIAS